MSSKLARALALAGVKTTKARRPAKFENPGVGLPVKDFPLDGGPHTTTTPIGWVTDEPFAPDKPHPRSRRRQKPWRP